MDWIKVLNRHVIFEYNDLSDSEFRAWIKIMSLAAFLEHEPTRDQMLKYAHHATLKSLDEKLMKHSCTLHDVLMKVLCDAHEVSLRRQAWKEKKKQQRALNKNVPVDVPVDVPDIEKRREREEKRKRKNTTFIIPTIEDVSGYCKERGKGINPQTWFDHYTSNGWMVGKNKMRDWRASVRTWETRGGNGNGTGTVRRTEEVIKKAGRASSDGQPYPIDNEF